MNIIDFKGAKCKHCYKCVRYCDVKAIMIKNERAEIIPERCVLCGHCLQVCPQSAKTLVSDLDKVKYMISRGETEELFPLLRLYGTFKIQFSGTGQCSFKKTGICRCKGNVRRSGFCNRRV